MATTSTYPIAVPKAEDLIVGTQTYTAADPVLNNPTKNFTVQSIANLFLYNGTTNTIPMFSTTNALADSIITQGTNSISITGANGLTIDSGTSSPAELTLKGVVSAVGYGGGGIINVIGASQDFVSYKTYVKLSGGTTVASQVYDMSGDAWTWDGNMQVGVNTATSYNFKSGGNSQMVIYNNNVGIGTCLLYTSPSPRD